MKNFKSLIFAILVIAGMSFQIAYAITPFEQSAQTELISKLKDKDYKIGIDNANGNVVVTKGNNTYWISISGLRTPMLYTINVKGYAFTKEKDGLTVEQRREIAARTAAIVDNEAICKVVYNDGEVSFFMPMYSTMPEDVAQSFEKIVAQLNDTKAKFNEVMPKIQTEYMNELKAKNTNRLVVEQLDSLPATAIRCNISGFAMRVVDTKGREVSGYDKSIRKDNALFLQESVEITAEESGLVGLGVRIYNPDGKMLVPYSSSNYTTINVIDVKKGKKAVTYELDKFGYDKAGNWAAGEYRIEFVINGKVVYNGTFTIL